LFTKKRYECVLNWKWNYCWVKPQEVTLLVQTATLECLSSASLQNGYVYLFLTCATTYTFVNHQVLLSSFVLFKTAQNQAEPTISCPGPWLRWTGWETEEEEGRSRSCVAVWWSGRNVGATTSTQWWSVLQEMRRWKTLVGVCGIFHAFHSWSTVQVRFLFKIWGFLYFKI